MDADEAKAEWFNAFRNNLLFIRANPRKSVANPFCITPRFIMVAVSAHGVSAHS
jgi:hypothetical protein